jgi:site-specific recombinase XerD
MIGQEEAASLPPTSARMGPQLRNWLTREQAKEMMAVPDRSSLKGKRDYVIVALLVDCTLRRNELAELDVETIASPPTISHNPPCANYATASP